VYLGLHNPLLLVMIAVGKHCTVPAATFIHCLNLKTALSRPTCHGGLEDFVGLLQHTEDNVESLLYSIIDVQSAKQRFGVQP